MSAVIHIRKSDRNGSDGRTKFGASPNKPVVTYCGRESSRTDIGRKTFRNHVETWVPIMSHPQCPKYVAELNENLCTECRAAFK